MSQALTLARPYARAAFAIARDERDFPAWSQALAFAARVAADQAFIDRGFDVDFAAETLAQRRLDLVELARRQFRRRGHRGLDHAFGFGAQFLVEAGDFRQQREPAVVRQQRQEARERFARRLRRQQYDRIGMRQARVA